MLLYFLFSFVLFLDSAAIPLFPLLSISGDSSFEFNTKLFSNYLKFFLYVCYCESSSTLYNFRIPRRFLFFALQSFRDFLRFLGMISIKISVFPCALFQWNCLLFRFLFNFEYFTIPGRLLFSRCDRLGISGDSLFAVYRKLSSNVLYFFLDVC